MARATNAYRVQFITSQVTTLVPTAVNQTFTLRYGATPLNTTIVIRRAIRAGDVAVIKIELPEDAGVTIALRSNSIGGVSLLPTDQFDGGLYVTDGLTRSATFKFVGTAHNRWAYSRKSIPA